MNSSVLFKSFHSLVKDDNRLNNSNDKSINETYEILISLKRFISILSNAVLNKDSYTLDDLVKTYLPRYLFLKKDMD